MKRAVVTGATGTIGTALIDELIRNDMEVVVICNPDSERNDRIPEDEHIRKLYCPLCRLKSLENTTGKEYDVFYHLAWQGTGGPFRNDIYLQYRNVQYSLDAVGAAKRFGCRTFIGAGSQAEYGRFNGKLKPETPAFPETGYGIGKLSAGLMTREYAHQAGLRHIWVRVLSVYGPNDSSQTMIMSVIKSIREGKTPELTKGEQMWDYMYSKDVARAFYLVGEKGKNGSTYCLGSGNARLLKEYVMMLRDAIDSQLPLGIGDVPYGDKQVMYLCANIDNLREDTGFVPEISFEEGIKETIEWCKNTVLM